MARNARCARPLRLVILRCAIAMVVSVFIFSGCASVAGYRIGYASWSHLAFSVRATWDEFVGWAPVATSTDAVTAEREGGWWGDEVPTLLER